MSRVEILDSVHEGKIALQIETLERRLDYARRALLDCEHVRALADERDRLVERIQESRRAAAVVAEKNLRQAARAEDERRRTATTAG